MRDKLFDPLTSMHVTEMQQLLHILTDPSANRPDLRKRLAVRVEHSQVRLHVARVHRQRDDLRCLGHRGRRGEVEEDQRRDAVVDDRVRPVAQHAAADQQAVEEARGALLADARVQFRLQLLVFDVGDRLVAEGDLLGLEVDAFLGVGEQAEAVLVLDVRAVERPNDDENEQGDEELVAVDDQRALGAAALLSEKESVRNAFREDT